VMLQIVVEAAGTVCDADCSIFSQTGIDGGRSCRARPNTLPPASSLSRSAYSDATMCASPVYSSLQLHCTPV